MNTITMLPCLSDKSQNKGFVVLKNITCIACKPNSACGLVLLSHSPTITLVPNKT